MSANTDYLLSGERTLALDFDKVIHRYSKGFADGSIYDPPMFGTRDALVYLSGKYRLVIFTARDDLDSIWKWLTNYDLAKYIADVTHTKPKAVAYVDDRAIEFKGDWQPVLRRL